MMYDASMRLTYTPEADLEGRLNDLVQSSDRSMNSILNELVRKGLAGSVPPPAEAPFAVRPFPGGFQPGIDPERLGEYLDDLDAEEFIRVSNQRDLTGATN